jgi:hypothetical protein
MSIKRCIHAIPYLDLCNCSELTESCLAQVPKILLFMITMKQDSRNNIKYGEEWDYWHVIGEKQKTYTQNDR